jgi:hypothetical protein
MILDRQDAILYCDETDLPPSLSHSLGLGASAAQSTSGTLEVVLGPARAPLPIPLAAPRPRAPPPPLPRPLPLVGPVLTFFSLPGLPMFDDENDCLYG